ncbi:glycosyltransferase [Escherichia coli]|uniref:glycosyltransferase n=1 Tax=Escherichia coli TaxID=562 RepID=UPI000BDF498F|nr:glycosyltransferase [Escherichia coli]
MSSVSVCIVTFNRKNDLLRCLDNVLKQSHVVSKILIYDNASTDGTTRFLLSKYCAILSPSNIPQKIATLNDINIWLVTATENSGGAGGFHYSVKLSREIFDTDYYWLMDDDGYPSKDCLNILMQYAETHNSDYVMPVSIDIDNNEKLSWPTRKKNHAKTECYKELYESWGDVMDYVTPFNGSLLSKKCIDSVGYVNKDFFIWGDEYEHYWRCKKAGIHPVTIMNAKFYHPSQKLPLQPCFFGLIKLPYVDSPLRMVCLVRNYTYIYKKYDSKLKIILKLISYSWFFLITRKLDVKGFVLYLKSVLDGLRNDFTRHRDFL